MISVVISNHLRVLLIGLVLLGGPARSWAVGAALAGPSPAGLGRLEKLRVHKMGVDRAGNLWAWGSGLGMVTVISPAGIDLGMMKATGAMAIDVDSEWGVVGLFLDGYEIQWLKTDGESRVTIRLAGPAAEVCWLGPDRVAVAPQTAGHRIEIWDLKNKALVKTLGEETPLHPVPGATRMRAVLLRNDFERGLLYSLESFTGDLQVFDREGKLAWKSTVENPRRHELEKWLQEVDTKARAEKDVQIPTVYVLRLALSPRGDLWVLQRRDEERHREILIQVGRNESSTHTLQEGACPSLNFVIWQSRIVTFREPESPQGSCVGWLPLP